jgi:signal transduction histidine kinase
MGRSSKSQAERSATDTSLRAERRKIDEALAIGRSNMQRKADEVVRLARERADETVRKARRRADHMEMPSERKRELASERAAEDRTLACERAVADELLHVERGERERALIAHFRVERLATDQRLGTERTRADELIETRDEFMGMVSHDLRSMLGGISLNAARLESHGSTGEGDAVVLDHALRIQRFAVRMDRLIGDLLDVVSLDAGKLEIRPEPRDALELVRDADEAFGPAFAAAGIGFRTRSAKRPLMARLDHDRILQVLSNLLGNAMKFTPRGGRVSLSVTRVEAQIRFSVVDTGSGIPADKLSTVFERFHRGAADDRRGHGLGLYIARRIVEAHGGAIWIESPNEGGTAIHFTVPPLLREVP